MMYNFDYYDTFKKKKNLQTNTVYISFVTYIQSGQHNIIKNVRYEV